MSTKNYLIVGATGKQGGAVLDSLLKGPSSSTIHIFALTRNADSSRAKSLSAIPQVSVIVGDPAIPEPIFAATGSSLDGVFCMTVPDGKVSEEDQAKALIDASIKYRVKHFVFSSADRGGPLSDTNPTTVPNLLSKHNIEEYLKEQAEGRMTWSILRPSTFMDMLTTDIHGKGFGRLWEGLGSKPLQLVSTKDIGHFGAIALANPAEYEGKAIGLAGDELTFEEASKIFKKTTGNEMPLAPCIVGKGLKWAVSDLGPMFKWLETHGFAVDIQSLQKEYPELQTFQQWLENTSAFRKIK